MVVIDEVQKAPGLFSQLRMLVDREDNPCRFLILGSASRDLIRQGSETMAGRISFLEVPPFSGQEFTKEETARLWLRGGYPRSYLSDTDKLSWEWREQYVRTFLERDIPALGITIPAESIRRLWLMLAHYHGQAELDLFIVKDGKRLGFEFKYGDAPKLTRSMKQAFEVLELDKLEVVYPGTSSYPLAEGISVSPLSTISSHV